MFLQSILWAPDYLNVTVTFDYLNVIFANLSQLPECDSVAATAPPRRTPAKIVFSFWDTEASFSDTEISLWDTEFKILRQ